MLNSMCINCKKLNNDCKGTDCQTWTGCIFREVSTEKTIKLHGIYGHHNGTAVKNLKTGDVIIWNFKYKSEVVELIPSKTGKTITAMLKSQESGNILPRKMGAERLVVVVVE